MLNDLMFAARNNPTSSIVPILVLCAIVAICATVFLVVTWNVEPWTRKYLKPRKQWLADWWRVRIYKLRAKHPEAFVGETPWAEQHIDVEKLVDDVTGK